MFFRIVYRSDREIWEDLVKWQGPEKVTLPDLRTLKKKKKKKMMKPGSNYRCP